MSPDINTEESGVPTAAASTPDAAARSAPPNRPEGMLPHLQRGDAQQGNTGAPLYAWSTEDAEEDPAILEAPRQRSGRSLTVWLVAILAVAAAACATLLAFGLPPFHAPEEALQEKQPTHAVVPGTQEQQQAPNGQQATALCHLYEQVHEEVVANTHMANPDSSDPVGQLAVAANARLALFAGGQLLREGIHDNPEASPDLRKDLGEMATTLDNLTLGYLAGSSNFALDPLRNQLDRQIYSSRTASATPSPRSRPAPARARHPAGVA